MVAMLAAAVAPLVIRAVNAPRETESLRRMSGVNDSIVGAPARGLTGFVQSMGRLPTLDGGILAELAERGPDPIGDAGSFGVPMGWVGPYMTTPTQLQLQDAWFGAFTVDQAVDAGTPWRLNAPGTDKTASTADDLIVPASYIRSTGILRLTLARDIGVISAVSGGTTYNPLVQSNVSANEVSSMTVYYANTSGVETSLAGSLVSGSTTTWQFLSSSVDAALPLGTHAVKIITTAGAACASCTFWRNVTLSQATNNITMAIAYNLSSSGGSFCCRTQSTGWSTSGSGVSMSVDTSACAYTATPSYLPHLYADSGTTPAPDLTTGGEIALAPTNVGFTVIVTPTSGSITAATANANNWRISWCGTP